MLYTLSKEKQRSDKELVIFLMIFFLPKTLKQNVGVSIYCEFVVFLLSVRELDDDATAALPPEVSEWDNLHMTIDCKNEKNMF